MSDFTLIADGLAFPEGPVALPNGDVLLVEIAGGRITRVKPDGAKETVAEHIVHDAQIGGFQVFILVTPMP